MIIFSFWIIQKLKNNSINQFITWYKMKKELPTYVNSPGEQVF
jgi:hypothetical protein